MNDIYIENNFKYFMSAENFKGKHVMSFLDFITETSTGPFGLNPEIKIRYHKTEKGLTDQPTILPKPLQKNVKGTGEVEEDLEGIENVEDVAED
ncbi:MAG: hypothetical protein JWQ98_1889 [Chlorobi bacterium]|nr:hypothetical protein [Chlorobiota bacterium]